MSTWECEKSEFEWVALAVVQNKKGFLKTKNIRKIDVGLT